METNGFISIAEDWLYASLYAPDVEAPRSGVVLVAPYGEEKKCSARLLVRLARALMSRGAVCLTIDLAGTGESPEPDGPFGIERWTGEIAAVFERLRTRYPDCSWALAGFRLGACLVATAAARATPDRLLLVEPFPNGQAFLEELLRRVHIQDMMTGQAHTRPEPDDVWKQGGTVDFAGYRMTSRLAAGLRQLDLMQALKQLPSSCRVQLIRVSASDRLPARWRPLYDYVKEQPEGGIQTVKDKPFWGQIDYYESDTLIDTILAALHR